MSPLHRATARGVARGVSCVLLILLTLEVASIPVPLGWQAGGVLVAVSVDLLLGRGTRGRHNKGKHR